LIHLVGNARGDLTDHREPRGEDQPVAQPLLLLLRLALGREVMDEAEKLRRRSIAQHADRKKDRKRRAAFALRGHLAAAPDHTRHAALEIPCNVLIVPGPPLADGLFGGHALPPSGGANNRFESAEALARLPYVSSAIARTPIPAKTQALDVRGCLAPTSGPKCSKSGQFWS
jgi:hypothetical protein